MFTTWFTTQVLPALISAASGALFGALIAGWDKVAARLLLEKVGPSINTIYNIVDPILDGTIRGWKDSDVDKAIALVIEIVNDGKLDAEEINKLVRFISEKWLPQIATEKVIEGVISDKELAVAEKIREAVETGSLDTPGLAETLRKTYLV
jgi:hypothetical protein